LAVVVTGGARLCAQSPPKAEGDEKDVRLDPKKSYPAEPWYRSHAETVAGWANAVKARPNDPNNVKLRWAISALALYHAARVTSSPAADEWRTAARSKAGTLAQAEQFVIDKQNRKVILTKATLDEKFNYSPLNYGVPFVLMLNEHLAAGIDFARVPDRANLADFEKHDRDPISSLGFSKDWSRERLPLALMLLWMSPKADKAPSLDDPFDTGSLVVEGAGWSGDDPGATGSVLMGMQSAMNLGLLDGCRRMQAADRDLPPWCHKPRGDGPITYDEFRDRWADTLVHTIGVMCFGGFAADDPNWSDVNKTFKREQLTGQERNFAPRLWQQAYYYKRGDGRLERRLYIRPAAEVGEGPPIYARTTKRYSSQSPYQTASCGYTLLIASRLLKQILDEAENDNQPTVGTQYRLERAGTGRCWKLLMRQQQVAKHVATLSFGRGPHTGLQIARPKGGQAVSVDDILDELLTGLVRALYQGGGLVAQSSEADESVKNSPYGLFTIGKFFVATGYPDVVGQYYWHRDFCKRLEDTTKSFKKPAEDVRCDHEFAILTALQAYQPAYSSAGRASGQSGGGK
jgi:hypothetical protein